MFQRAKSAGLQVMREVASLPLRALGTTQRRRALEELTNSMVSEVHLSDGTLRFMTPTPLLQARARAVLSKEPDTIQWINSFGSGDVFWDVGANVGVFSLYAARCCGVHVLAFEPSADNYMVLCRNVDINSLGESITPFCIAFSDQTQLGVLNLASRTLGAALHQFGRAGESSRWSDGKNIGTHGMLGYTVDDFIREFNPPFPNRLKLDVDGLEWQILQGAANTLHDPRLQSVMVELTVSDETERNRAITWLSGAGFELVSQGETQANGREMGANHFFSRMRTTG
jgi:FkbM family methyltransferase